LKQAQEYIGNEYTFLLPGELIVTGECLKVSTILGSCVSVCLFDEVHKIAGMNHYLLPINKQKDSNQFRYGDESLEYMLNQMLSMGSVLSHIKAGLYGGSSMFEKTFYSYNVGQQNIEVGKRFLETKGILIKEAETGGTLGRKIIFDTNTGTISSSLLTGRFN
jgi:chemotaxis protein CheD